ncbi:MAG TPA: hypothetical protein VFX12_12270 [Vicinamibacterales bacterium]|nr:hypothetical protein [Vicinamibacterales bacterium]
MLRSTTAVLESRAGPGPRGPRAGDLLVTKRSARRDRYTLSRVPHAPVFEVRGGRRAIALGVRLAAHVGVPAWYTEDHRHFRPLGAGEAGLSTVSATAPASDTEALVPERRSS